MLGGSLVIRPQEKGGLARIPISCQARWVQTKSPSERGTEVPRFNTMGPQGSTQLVQAGSKQTSGAAYE